MTDRELLQEALESIKWLRIHLERDHGCLHMKPAVSGITDWLNKTEAALCARLAQPEEKLFTEAQVLDIAQKLSDSAALNSVPIGWVKKKEWVGLTDEEMMQIYVALKSVVGFYSVEKYARAIEAKLKEKNSD